jgi:hypothetical protein
VKAKRVTISLHALLPTHNLQGRPIAIANLRGQAVRRVTPHLQIQVVAKAILHLQGRAVAGLIRHLHAQAAVPVHRLPGQAAAVQAERAGAEENNNSKPYNC